jgi:hypothetical protein
MRRRGGSGCEDEVDEAEYRGATGWMFFLLEAGIGGFASGVNGWLACFFSFKTEGRRLVFNTLSIE